MAVLRTTLAMVLAVLASWCATTAAASAAASSRAPAADCETLDLTDAAAVREHADAATDVFAGRVRTVRARTTDRDGDGRGGDAPRQDPDSDVRRYDHAVTVKRTFRGDLEFNQEVRVVTRPRTADNGFGKLTAGRWYVFFVVADEGRTALYATCDSGTQALMDGLSSEAEGALEGALAEPDEEMPEVSLTAPEDGAGSAPSYGRLAAPGAALALLGVLGLLLLVRVGRRRA